LLVQTKPYSGILTPPAESNIDPAAWRGVPRPGDLMKRFIEAADSEQSTLPECLDDWFDESNSVCVIDAFVQELISTSSGSRASNRRRQVGRLTTLPRCRSSTSTGGTKGWRLLLLKLEERAMLSWNYQRPRRPRSLAARKCGWHQSYRLRRTVYSSYQCANGHRHNTVSADKKSPATRRGG